MEKCAQDVSNRANIQAVVQQALHQAAEATAQQLGILDIGRAAANLGFNYSDIEQSLALAITEQFTVTCTAQFVSEQSFTCNNSRVYLSEGLNLHNYQQSLIDCTQRAVSTTNAFLQLQQILSQSAVAKEESLFSIYITIILIVIAVIVIIIIANQASVHSKSTTGALAVTNNRVTWICIGVVIIVAVSAIAYAWFASSNNWWPFLKPTNSNISGYQVG